MKLSQILLTGLAALVMASDISGNRDCAKVDVHYSLKSTSGYSPFVPDCWKVVQNNPQDMQVSLQLHTERTRMLIQLDSPVGKDPVSASWGTCVIRFYLSEGGSMTINHQQLSDLFYLIRDNCQIQLPGEDYPRMESHGEITCGPAAVKFDIFQPSKTDESS
ncbi:hypothetical protein QBC44DRAFT_307073 [Cladorrhinum sp. PSN332]|nr:hypothetical protein QBC44DRAFT_307073 [Cladorrhinum sp. PSN332]